jgi:thioesterase domain-containing protein
LEVIEVPGDHDSMVLEPNVRVMAAKLKAVIARVEGDKSNVVPLATAAE